MNPAELTGSLALLGMSQMDAARLFQVNGRTVRRWIAGEQEVPEAVAIALRLKLENKQLMTALMRIDEAWQSPSKMLEIARETLSNFRERNERKD